VESLDESAQLEIPEIIECNDIPNNREEIPSRAVASNYPHMKDSTRFTSVCCCVAYLSACSVDILPLVLLRGFNFKLYV
jgi:hypothetical protein